MRNIKTFRELFENSIGDKSEKIFSFDKDQYQEFSEYCQKNGLTIWEPSKHVTLYTIYTEKFGKFYIIDNQFLVMCKGEIPEDVEIINGSDLHNKYDPSGKDIHDIILKKLDCSDDDLRMSLWVAKITGESPITNAYGYLENYFRMNPLEMYKLDDYPEIKKEILDKNGAKDYGSIGLKLRRGII